MRTHAGSSLHRHIDAYLDVLQVRNYSLSKIHGTRIVLEFLARFLAAQSVRDVRRVNEGHLTAFAAYLPKHESARFRVPLSVSTQRYWIGCVRAFFTFLEAKSAILRNPATELVLPKLHALPRGVLLGTRQK